MNNYCISDNVWVYVVVLMQHTPCYTLARLITEKHKLKYETKFLLK